MSSQDTPFWNRADPVGLLRGLFMVFSSEGVVSTAPPHRSLSRIRRTMRCFVERESAAVRNTEAQPLSYLFLITFLYS